MCQSPIWIRNRAYSSRTIGLTDRKVLLMNRPWDYFTQRIMVPCGRCEECLRQQRNDWYVRLERETKYQKSLHRNSVFVTITIAPEYYDSALLNPSAFIRMWFERVRRRFGHSIKHAVFQEFGMHPDQGNEPRLHFHGVLWDVSCSYKMMRDSSTKLKMKSIVHKFINFTAKVNPIYLYTYYKSNKIILRTNETKCLIPKIFHQKCEIFLETGIETENITFVQKERKLNKVITTARIIESKNINQVIEVFN